MKVIILAGGSGTRLWPLSRKKYPKQFLKINPSDSQNKSVFNKGSLLQQTLERILKIVSINDIIIMTNDDYKFHIKADIMGISQKSCDNIILEPIKRNTAPAIALGIRYCKDFLKCKKEEVIFISPSDHIIEPQEKFLKYLKIATKLALKGVIVTFGIKPFYPETGYGYIKIGNKIENLNNDVEVYKVERFVEKPDIFTAKDYISKGNYYWNSGMFIFSIETMEKEFQRYASKIFSLYSEGYEMIVNNFDQMPNISIDYAIMEKSDKVVTLPMDIYWNDIGSWDSIFNIFPKDDKGNVKIGNILTHNTKNSLIMSEKRLIATVGVENMLIIETDDAILVAKKGDAQKVKKIVERLESEKRQEVIEHTTVYRPWGKYTVLEKGQRYRIKKIVVNKGEKLSLQLHHHRSEHWVVIRGTAKVVIGNETKYIHENESVYIPKSTLHRLENPGKIPLEIIEVQNGEYIEEDDIVRIEDCYGRENL